MKEKDRFQEISQETFPPDDEELESLVLNLALKQILRRMSDKEYDKECAAIYKDKDTKEIFAMLRQEYLEKHR